MGPPTHPAPIDSYHPIGDNRYSQILYRSRHLQQCAAQEREAVRAWGPQVGRRYVERLGTVRTAEKLDDLFTFQQLHFHPLTGDRAGQYACSLTGAWRIILTSPEETT